MEKYQMIFDEPQPVYTASANGKVLYLTNGKEVEVNISEEEKAKKWKYDAAWLELGGSGAVTEAALLKAAKQGVVDEITAYDDSSAVNEFFVNGKSTWKVKDIRLGLRRNVEDKKFLGEKTIKLWISDKDYVEPTPDVAEQMLRVLENYCFECYNVTAGHKAAVEALASVEEVLAYDYTNGYPEKLNFTV